MPRNLERPLACFRAHAGSDAARHPDGQCHRKQTASLFLKLTSGRVGGFQKERGKGEKVG